MKPSHAAFQGRQSRSGLSGSRARSLCHASQAARAHGMSRLRRGLQRRALAVDRTSRRCARTSMRRLPAQRGEDAGRLSPYRRAVCGRALDRVAPVASQSRGAGAYRASDAADHVDRHGRRRDGHHHDRRPSGAQSRLGAEVRISGLARSQIQSGRAARAGALASIASRGRAVRPGRTCVRVRIGRRVACGASAAYQPRVRRGENALARRARRWRAALPLAFARMRMFRARRDDSCVRRGSIHSPPVRRQHAVNRGSLSGADAQPDALGAR